MAEQPIKNNTNILMIGLFSFLITVVVAGTFIFLTLRQSNPAPRLQAKEEIGPLVSLGNEIIVNIASEEGSEHYLKVKVTVETDGEESLAEATKRVPQIRDLTINILSSKTKEKINEKEGKDAIRSEIINSINQYLVSGKVKNIYFEDFVMQ